MGFFKKIFGKKKAKKAAAEREAALAKSNEPAQDPPRAATAGAQEPPASATRQPLVATDPPATMPSVELYGSSAEDETWDSLTYKGGAAGGQESPQSPASAAVKVTRKSSKGSPNKSPDQRPPRKEKLTPTALPKSPKSPRPRQPAAASTASPPQHSPKDNNAAIVAPVDSRTQRSKSRSPGSSNRSTPSDQPSLAAFDAALDHRSVSQTRHNSRGASSNSLREQNRSATALGTRSMRSMNGSRSSLHSRNGSRSGSRAGSQAGSATGSRASSRSPTRAPMSQSVAKFLGLAQTKSAAYIDSKGRKAYERRTKSYHTSQGSRPQIQVHANAHGLPRSESRGSAALSHTESVHSLHSMHSTGSRERHPGNTSTRATSPAGSPLARVEERQRKPKASSPTTHVVVVRRSGPTVSTKRAQSTMPTRGCNLQKASAPARKKAPLSPKPTKASKLREQLAPGKADLADQRSPKGKTSNGALTSLRPARIPVAMTRAQQLRQKHTQAEHKEHIASARDAKEAGSKAAHQDAQPANGVRVNKRKTQVPTMRPLRRPRSRSRANKPRLTKSTMELRSPPSRRKRTVKRGSGGTQKMARRYASEHLKERTQSPSPVHVTGHVDPSLGISMGNQQYLDQLIGKVVSKSNRSSPSGRSGASKSPRRVPSAHRSPYQSRRLEDGHRRNDSLNRSLTAQNLSQHSRSPKKGASPRLGRPNSEVALGAAGRARAVNQTADPTLLNESLHVSSDESDGAVDASDTTFPAAEISADSFLHVTAPAAEPVAARTASGGLDEDEIRLTVASPAVRPTSAQSDATSPALTSARSDTAATGLFDSPTSPIDLLNATSSNHTPVEAAVQTSTTPLAERTPTVERTPPTSVGSTGSSGKKRNMPRLEIPPRGAADVPTGDTTLVTMDSPRTKTARPAAPDADAIDYLSDDSEDSYETPAALLASAAAMGADVTYGSKKQSASSVIGAHARVDSIMEEDDEMDMSAESLASPAPSKPTIQPEPVAAKATKSPTLPATDASDQTATPEPKQSSPGPASPVKTPSPPTAAVPSPMVTVPPPAAKRQGLTSPIMSAAMAAYVKHSGRSGGTPTQPEIHTVTFTTSPYYLSLKPRSEGGAVIMATKPGTYAAKHLRVQDYLLQFDGEEVSGLSAAAITDLMTGRRANRATPRSLTVMRLVPKSSPLASAKPGSQ